MGWACRTCGRIGKFVRNLIGKPHEKCSINRYRRKDNFKKNLKK